MRSTVDVDLPDGTGDDAYLEILLGHLPRLFGDGGEFPVPKLVFFQAGVDPLQVTAGPRLPAAPCRVALLREGRVARLGRPEGAIPRGAAHAQGDLMGRLSLTRNGLLRRNNAVYRCAADEASPLLGVTPL